MVACIIAMIVCGVLGLFSARYRAIAVEAFKCTFRLITFRPCNTNLDQRIRAKLTSKLLKKTPGAAKFVYKYFNVLSVILVVIFFASLGYSAYSIYNLSVHGTCDLNNPESCPFNPSAKPGEPCNITFTGNVSQETPELMSMETPLVLSKQYKGII